MKVECVVSDVPREEISVKDLPVAGSLIVAPRGKFDPPVANYVVVVLISDGPKPVFGTLALCHTKECAVSRGTALTRQLTTDAMSMEESEEKKKMKVRCLVYNACREDVPGQDLPEVGNFMVTQYQQRMGPAGVYSYILSRRMDDKAGIPRFSTVATLYNLEDAALCGSLFAEHFSKKAEE